MYNKDLIKEMAEVQISSLFDYTLDEFFGDWFLYKGSIDPEHLVRDGHIKIGSTLSIIDVLLEIECNNKPKAFWYTVPNGLYRKN